MCSRQGALAEGVGGQRLSSGGGAGSVQPPDPGRLGRQVNLLFKSPQGAPPGPRFGDICLAAPEGALMSQVWCQACSHLI